MIDIKKIRELYIASSPFDTFDKSGLKDLNYEKWVTYIDNNDIFIWYEDTEDGKNILSNMDSIPDDFKKSTLSLFNKNSCYADFNRKKNYYNIGVIFHEKLKYIVVSFERKVKTNDLKLFLDMAKYLDAYLLYKRTEIIDEKVIESLK